MKAEYALAIFFVAGTLYLAYHIAMWAVRGVEVLPL